MGHGCGGCECGSGARSWAASMEGPAAVFGGGTESVAKLYSFVKTFIDSDLIVNFDFQISKKKMPKTNHLEWVAWWPWRQRRLSAFWTVPISASAEWPDSRGHYCCFGASRMQKQRHPGEIKKIWNPDRKLLYLFFDWNSAYNNTWFVSLSL